MQGFSLGAQKQCLVSGRVLPGEVQDRMNTALRLCCLLTLLSVGRSYAAPLRIDFTPRPDWSAWVGTQPTVLKISPCQVPPTVDGRPDDTAWQTAAQVKFPTRSSTYPVTDVAICFDAGGLYLLVQCPEQAGRQRVAPPRDRDGRVYADDCIELFFDVTGTGSDVYQFIVSAANSIYDAHNDDAQGYNPDWEHAVTGDAQGWCAEISLPVAAFGLSTWRPALNFNIGRNGPGLGDRAWVGAYGDTSAGRLQFEGVTDAPGQTPPTTGEPLGLHMQRTSARPGERWIEGALRLGTDQVVAGTVVRATLRAPGADRVLATLETPATAATGTIAADLRGLTAAGAGEADLLVELLRDGRTVAQQRASLSAAPPERTLPPDLRIPISVDPPPGAPPLRNWPITFGVPFPAGTLWSAENVRVVDDTGAEVPSQREAVALWGPEGAIKWLRFDLAVSAGRSYFVELGPGRASPQPAVTLTRTGDAITLDTGAASYLLGPGPSPIHEIRLGRHVLASSAGARGLYVVDQRGRTASLAAEGETIQIEAAGPQAACVRFEGDYRTEQGEVLAHQITRVEAFAGQPFARITHTFVITRDTNELWFREIGWELAAAPGPDAAALLAVARDDPAQVHRIALNATASGACMFQDQHFRFMTGSNHFAAGPLDAQDRLAPQVEGEEMGDWAALAGRAGTLLLACREAARQHPKEFELHPDRVVLKLFSNRAGEELDFRAPTLVQKWDLPTWYEKTISSPIRRPREEVIKQASALEASAIGWAKTHELLLAPMPADADVARLAETARLHSHPVYVLADPEWICGSGALGPLPIHPRDPERFPAAEATIDAAVRHWYERNDRFGEYGFMDYYMGPHLNYRGDYAVPYRYCVNTYTLRADLWTLYARSGDRLLREFAEGTNRAQMEGCMAHWDGPRAVRGLWHTPDGTQSRNGEVYMGMFPFYWCAYQSVHTSSSSNLKMLILDYYLTGYRRARDGVLDYIYGVKKSWSPAAVARDERQLARMRLLLQCYAFTWDPDLRDMAEAVFDVVYRPDAELGLFQSRSIYPTEERNTSYKTQVDLRGVMDGWQILGTQRYHDVATKLARYWWQNFLGDWPLFYTNPLGLAGAWLYRETGDARYLQGLANAIRHAASAYDPQTGEVASVDGAEKVTFLFEGIPLAQATLVAADPALRPFASWAGYEDFGFPATIVVFKRGNTPIELDFDPANATAGTAPGQEEGLSLNFRVTPVNRRDDPSAALPYLKRWSYNNHSILIPANAPDGAYEIVPTEFGQQVAVASSRVPMVIYAPHFWRPAPPQVPPIRYYFKVPQGARDAQIIFEGSALLFDPTDTAWPANEPQHGVVDLPADRPGLWSFLPVQSELVKVRNLPPFFAVESPDAYFEPPIPWEREEPPVIETPPASTDYIAGAINTPGNRALYVTRPALQIDLGGPHPSGDGNQFMPSRHGTIELWFRPSWSGVDLLPPKPGSTFAGRTLLRMEVPSGQQAYSLTYRMAPRNRDAWMDFNFSHCLNAFMMSTCLGKPNSLQAWRRTVMIANEWMHIAWVWGPRDGIVPQTVPYHTKPQKDVLVAELYVNGRRGQQYNYRNYQALLTEVPLRLSIYDLQGAVDELRISDVQRYTHDFPPPARDRELEVDEHTRLLMHFNGDLQCAAFGYEGESPAQLK